MGKVLRINAGDVVTIGEATVTITKIKKPKTIHGTASPLGIAIDIVAPRQVGISHMPFLMPSSPCMCGDEDCQNCRGPRPEPIPVCRTPAYIGLEVLMENGQWHEVGTASPQLEAERLPFGMRAVWHGADDDYVECRSCESQLSHCRCHVREAWDERQGWL